MQCSANPMAINVGAVYFEARLSTKSLLGDVKVLQKQLTKTPVELNIKPIFNKKEIDSITKSFTTVGKKLGRDLGKTIGKDIATQVSKSVASALKDSLKKDFKVPSGTGKKIGEQLGDDIAKGAAKGGEKAGKGLADDVAKGAKGGGDKAGKTLAEEFSSAFDSTVGDRTVSKIRSVVNSLSNSLSKYLPKELGDAFATGVPVIQRSFELWKETGKKEGQTLGEALMQHFDFGSDLWQQLSGKLPAEASAFAKSLGGQLGKFIPVELSTIVPNLMSTFKGAMIAGAVGIGLGIAGKIGFELAKGLTEAFANAVGTINKFAIDAGKAVIGVLATSVDAAAEVDKQLTLAVGVTGLAAREGMDAAREGIEELRKAVIDVGTDPRFIVTPKGLADSSNILAKAGFQVNQIGESLQQLAAVSTSSGEAVDKVTESFLDSTAKFNLGTEEQAEAMGAFFGTLTSAKLESRELVKSLQYFNPGQEGIAGFQESVRLFGLMATQGLRGSMAATSLNNALNRAHKAAELLGISLFDVNGTRKSQLDLMLEIGETYGDINFQLEENQQLGIDLQKAFGQQGIRAVQAFSKVTKEQIQQVEEAIAGGVTTLGDVSSLMLEQVGAAQVGLDNAIDGILLRIGFATAPIVNSIKVVASGLVNALGSIENVPAWDVLASTSESLSEAFKDPAVQEGIRTINQALADILNASLLRIVDIINYIIDWLGNPEAVHEFVETIKDLISVVEIGLRGAFGVVAFQVETVLSLAATLSETFDQVRAGLEQTQQGINLGEIVEREGAKTQQFFNGIRDRLVEIAQNPEFQSFLQRIPPFILQVKNSLERTLKPVIDSIVQFLEVNGASLGQLALQLLGIIGDIAPIVGQVLAIAIDLVSIVTQGVTKALEVVPVIDIISTGISAISVAVEGVLNLIRQILSVFLEVQDGALSTLAGVTQGFRDSLALARAGLSSFGNDLFDVFENIGDAIGEAIKNAISISLQWAIDRIGEVFDRVTGLGQNAELQARQARDRELGISTPTQRATRRVIEAAALSGIEESPFSSPALATERSVVRGRSAVIAQQQAAAQARRQAVAVAGAGFELPNLRADIETWASTIRSELSATNFQLPGVLAGAEDFVLPDLRGQIENWSNALSDLYKEADDGLSQWDKQVKSLGKSALAQVSYFIKQSDKLVNKFIKELVKDIENLLREVRRKIEKTWELVQRFLTRGYEQLIQEFSNTFRKLLAAVQKLIEDVWLRIRNYLLNGINRLWQLINEGFRNLISGIQELATTGVNRIVNVVQAGVSQLWSYVQNSFNTVVTQIQQAATSAWEYIRNTIIGGLAEIFNNLAIGASQAIENARAIFIAGWENIRENVLNILSGLWSGIQTQISRISFAGLSQSLLSIRTAALSALEGFRDWVATLSPVQFIVQSIESAFNNVRSAASRVQDIFNNLSAINIPVLGQLQGVQARQSPWADLTDRNPLRIPVIGRLSDIQIRQSPWQSVSESNPYTIPLEGNLVQVDIDPIQVDLQAQGVDLSGVDPTLIAFARANPELASAYLSSNMALAETISPAVLQNLGLSMNQMTRAVNSAAGVIEESGVTLDDLYERAGTYRFGDPVRGANEQIFTQAGLSQALIDLLKATEGFYANRYLDPTGTPTIGFGTAATAGETARKWLELGTITVEQANEALLEEIEEKDLIDKIVNALNFDPNINQLSALISLAYNGGIGAVYDLIAKGASAEAIAQNFPTHYTTSYGVPLQGLRTRRLLERELFISEPIVTGSGSSSLIGGTSTDTVINMPSPNVTGVNLADVGALDLNRLFTTAVSGAIEVANDQQSDVAQAVLDAAETYVGQQFNPGIVAQCMAFVRAVLGKANANLGDKLDSLVNKVTTEAIDGLTTSSLLASSLFGGDIGEIVTDRSQLQPGDLVAFYDTYQGWWTGRGAPTITHVAVYAGQDPTTGEQMIIDRSTSSRPVNYRPLDTFAQFAAGVRPFEYGSSTTDTAMVVNREAIQLDFTKLTETLKDTSVDVILKTFEQALAQADTLGIDETQVAFIRSLIENPEQLTALTGDSNIDFSVIPGVNIEELSKLPGFDLLSATTSATNLNGVAVAQQVSLLERIFDARGLDFTSLSETFKTEFDLLVESFNTQLNETNNLLDTLPSRLSASEREALIQAGILRTGAVRLGEEFNLPSLTGSIDQTIDRTIDPFLVTASDYFQDMVNLVMQTLSQSILPENVPLIAETIADNVGTRALNDTLDGLIDALESGSLNRLFGFLGDFIPGDILTTVAEVIGRYATEDGSGTQQTIMNFADLLRGIDPSVLTDLLQQTIVALSQVNSPESLTEFLSHLSTVATNLNPIELSAPDVTINVPETAQDITVMSDELAQSMANESSGASARATIASRLGATNSLRFNFTGMDVNQLVSTNQLLNLERSLNSPQFLDRIVDSVLTVIETDPQIRAELGLS